jgi:hypothetical protein
VPSPFLSASRLTFADGGIQPSPNRTEATAVPARPTVKTV